jgi:DNA processing protein
MASAPLRREVLLALNAAQDLSRAAICRLGADLDAWVGAAPAATAAASLGLPLETLARARSLLLRAGEVAARELGAAERLGARAVTLGEAGYPAAFGELGMPPPVLFVRGEIPERPAVAVVGSRHMDPYGREAATYFARSLAEAGMTIVSGFARGVDATAHEAALAVDRGTTVAVLGCGHGVDYPAGHGRLREAIVRGGAVVSEFSCEQPPADWTFPVRNRLIAALGLGVLIVQAAPRSGSLVTARLALEQGREIWAVPGRIFEEKGLGPNGLIRDGAQLVQHPRDILDGLPGWVRASLPAGPTPPDAVDAPNAVAAGAAPPLPGLPGRILCELVPGEPRTPDEIAALTGAALDQVLGTLLELELLGHLRRQPGPAYCRRLC